MDILSRLVLLCVLSNIVLCDRRRKMDFRVRFGVEDVDNKYPYIVKLTSENRPFACTGTLIAPTWVLTAGHCVDSNWPLSNFGKIHMRNNSTLIVFDVQKTFIHPKYSSPISMSSCLYNDIALLRLKNNTKLIAKCFNRTCSSKFEHGVGNSEVFGKLSALSYDSLVGYPVAYGGYGLMELEEEVDSLERPLQLGAGVVVNCEHKRVFCPTMCIAPKCSNKLQDTMNGDSGGPLFYDDKIVGVLTGGEHPVSMYAPVSVYLDWIHNTMITEDEQRT